MKAAPQIGSSCKKRITALTSKTLIADHETHLCLTSRIRHDHAENHVIEWKSEFPGCSRWNWQDFSYLSSLVKIRSQNMIVLAVVSSDHSGSTRRNRVKMLSVRSV